MRGYVINPEFWKEHPEVAARTISEEMQEHPAELWVVVIGDRKEAGTILDVVADTVGMMAVSD